MSETPEGGQRPPQRPRGPRVRGGAERGPSQPRRDPVVEARNQIAKEAGELPKNQQSGKPEDQAKKKLADRIKDLFRRKRTEASDVREDVKDKKTKRISDELRSKATDVKVAVAQTLEGVKQGVIDVPSANNRTLLLKIDEKLGGGLTDESASALYPLIDKLITSGDITLDEIKDEFDELRLYLSSGTLQDIKDAFKDYLQTGILGDLEDGSIDAFLGETKPTSNNENAVEDKEDDIDRTIAYEYAVIAKDLSPEERILMRALHNPFELREYIERIKREDGAKGLTGKELGIYVSRKLESDIVFLFERVYARVDQQSPDKEFSEIENEDLMKSIGSAKTRLSRAIRSLADKLSTPAFDDLFGKENKKQFYVHEIDRETYFTNIIEESSDDLKDAAEGDESEKMQHLKSIMRERMRSIPLAKQTDISELLGNIVSLVEEDLSVREYLHNVSLILRKPSGESGFWAGAAGYAEKLRSVSQDAISRLPDAQIMYAVNRELQKLLRARFAVTDWIHEHHMFTEVYENNRTEIEWQVQEEICKLYPELRDPKNHFRLRRAMSMGIGLGKGVYMNVIETAAWADPPQEVGEKGTSATIASYFTNDAMPLEPLNPKHAFIRWQAEGHTKGPLVYLTTEGFKKLRFGRKFTNHWDHRYLWDNAKKYSESYAKGRRVFKSGNPDEKVFIDQMDNFGHVGSLITRGGWRNKYALAGWMVTDANGKINPLESWKAVENIGYEAAKWFQSTSEVTSLLKVDAADAKDDESGAKKYEKKQEFLRYLYTKYINPDESTFESYYAELNSRAASEFDKTHKDQIARFTKMKDRKEQTRLDAGQMLVSRALAGMLKQRAPSIIMTVERGRNTAHGVNAYERLRKKLFFDEMAKPLMDKEAKFSDKAAVEHAQKTSKDRMDSALKDVMLVETKLRTVTSEKMHAFLREQQLAGKKQDLSQFPAKDYVLTEAFLETQLREIYATVPDMTPDAIDNKVKDAKALFSEMKNMMDEKYLSNFGDKIRDPNGFPFALAVDELDTSFYMYSNSGERPLARAMGDASGVETVAYKHMQELMGSFHKIATNGEKNKNLDSIVEHIHHVKHKLESIHGHAIATKVAYDLSALTISYFRQDRMAERIWTKWMRIGEYNSLAGEFTSLNRGVWEWNTGTVDSFVTKLEQADVLRRKAYDFTHAHVERHPRKLFGIIPFGTKTIREIEYDYTGNKLREAFGATKMDIFKTLLINYGPIIAMGFVALTIKRAIKERQEQHH